MVPLSWYLILAGVMFLAGVVGILIRRNVIALRLCAELILNSVNINFVAFSHYLQSMVGQMFVIFVLVVAAAEAAIGLALIIALFRLKGTLNMDEVKDLKG